MQKSIVEAFSQLQERVTALRYSPDGRLLVLGTEAAKVHVFQASRYKHIASHQQRDPSDNTVNSEIKDIALCVSTADATAAQLCVSTDNGDGYVATLKVTIENEVPVRTDLVSCVQLKKPKKIENGSIKHVRFVPFPLVQAREVTSQSA